MQLKNVCLSFKKTPWDFTNRSIHPETYTPVEDQSIEDISLYDEGFLENKHIIEKPLPSISKTQPHHMIVSYNSDQNNQLSQVCDQVLKPKGCLIDDINQIRNQSGLAELKPHDTNIDLSHFKESPSYIYSILNKSISEFNQSKKPIIFSDWEKIIEKMVKDSIQSEYFGLFLKQLVLSHTPTLENCKHFIEETLASNCNVKSKEELVLNALSIYFSEPCRIQDWCAVKDEEGLKKFLLDELNTQLSPSLELQLRLYFLTNINNENELEPILESLVKLDNIMFNRSIKRIFEHIKLNSISVCSETAICFIKNLCEKNKNNHLDISFICDALIILKKFIVKSGEDVSLFINQCKSQILAVNWTEYNYINFQVFFLDWECNQNDCQRIISKIKDSKLNSKHCHELLMSTLSTCLEHKLKFNVEQVGALIMAFDNVMSCNTNKDMSYLILKLVNKQDVLPTIIAYKSKTNVFSNDEKLFLAYINQIYDQSSRVLSDSAIDDLCNSYFKQVVHSVEDLKSTIAFLVDEESACWNISFNTQVIQIAMFLFDYLLDDIKDSDLKEIFDLIRFSTRLSNNNKKELIIKLISKCPMSLFNTIIHLDWIKINQKKKFLETNLKKHNYTIDSLKNWIDIIQDSGISYKEIEPLLKVLCKGSLDKINVQIINEFQLTTFLKRRQLYMCYFNSLASDSAHQFKNELYQLIQTKFAPLQIIRIMIQHEPQVLSDIDLLDLLKKFFSKEDNKGLLNDINKYKFEYNEIVKQLSNDQLNELKGLFLS